MKIKFRIPLPDWQIVHRMLERLNPGMTGQLDRWGRVTRSRSWLGGGIEIDAVAENTPHCPKCGRFHAEGGTRICADCRTSSDDRRSS